MSSRSRRVLAVFTLAFAVVALAKAEESPLEDCLKKEPVDCVRDLISRSLRFFFGPEGVELLKDDYGETGSASGTVSVVDSGSDSGRGVGSPPTVKDPRQRRSVGVVTSEDGSGYPGRNLGFESGSSEDANSESEGRGKKKKLKKKLLEYAIAHKILWMIWGVMLYFITAGLAKLALLKGTLALGIGGLIVLKKFLSQHHHVAKHEIHPHVIEHPHIPSGYGEHEYEGDHSAVYGGHFYPGR